MPYAVKLTGQQFWDTDAEFRADCLAIHNALIAGGLVQTSDTGQTDFTTNVRANGGTTGGYTMYRFNDVHQSSWPLFLKIEWYQTVVGRLGFSYSIGTGTNGAGTLSGVLRAVGVQTQVSGSSTGATGASTAENWISVGEGYVYILLGMLASAGNQVNCLMFIERSTDQAGVVHPEEGIVSWCSVANGKFYSMHPQGKAGIGPTGNSSPFDSGLIWQCFDDLEGADVGIMPAPYMFGERCDITGLRWPVEVESLTA